MAKSLLQGARANISGRDDCRPELLALQLIRELQGIWAGDVGGWVGGLERKGGAFMSFLIETFKAGGGAVRFNSVRGGGGGGSIKTTTINPMITAGK